MASFKPIQRKTLPRLKGDPTPDDQYWRNFDFPVTVKEYGPVQSVCFSRTKPHLFAVTTSAKVQVFNPRLLDTIKTFSRFKEAAYGAEFRSDGKLLAVGGEEGFVRIFDVATKSMLREFKNHKAPVHCTRFTTDNSHVISFGDDRSARYFDIPSQTQLRTFKDHGDYVRSGDVSLSSHSIFVSGSYDHKARVFDLRTNETVQEFNHGAPIESVLMTTSGNIVLTAGGTTIKVWDIVAGGSCLTSFSSHHKTITDLCFASGYSRLLSSSIDRHVKIYDMASYTVVHSMDFATPVLSIGVSPDDETLCVGMTDGVISIRKRKEPVDEEAMEQKAIEKKKWGKYLLKEKYYTPDESAIRVKEEEREFLKQHDKYLKKFQFTKALDRVLKYHVWSSMPDVTVTMMQELDRRSGLLPALAGRAPEDLVDILGFMCRYVTDARYANVVMGVAQLFWELYPFVYGKSAELDALIDRFQEILGLEIETQKELRGLLGVMDVLVSASEFSSAEVQADIIESNTASVLTALTPVPAVAV
ncbi:hypothetical protein RvY_13670 [Ramazzottius varieornatus]|uniref:U3 small nucleolar RNA-associated protein 15 homolog n=1 Tax=Ramazzottius varieornatus TaxID=947166 RepID=A0A1D1VQI4_RAMVA|nr:hypothetical protein RvY_13670 [Ramazzottius varieornatus]